jgi:hypothetical protein
VLGRKTKWREALAAVEEEARFKALKELSADAPPAAFDRWVDQVRERYVRHAKAAKELAVRCGDAVFAEGEDLASFKAALAKQRLADAEAAAAAERAKEAAAAAAVAAAEAREGEGEGEGVGALRGALRAVLAELQEARGAVAEHVAGEGEEEGKEERKGAAKGAGGAGAAAAEEEEEAIGEDALKAVLAVLLEKRREAEAEAGKKRKKAERRFRDMLDDKCRDLALSGTSFSAWERVREVIQREKRTLALIPHP